MNTPFEGGSNRFVLLGFLVVALAACFWLVRPFVEPIVLAFLVGMLAHPLHQRLVDLLRGRRNTAALLSCLLLCLVVLIPLALLMAAVVQQGISYSVVVRDWATQENIRELLSHNWVPRFRALLEQYLPARVLDPAVIRDEALQLAGGMGKQFADVSASLLGSFTRNVVNILLLVFVLFFVLRDYTSMIDLIRHALPLSRSQEDMLFREVKDVSKSALLGSLLTAATQGVVGGLGLWLAGFPGVFWGVVMAFASLIPMIGTALVWIPAAAYLALTGQYEWSLFLVAWGVLVVGSIDNFLRPLFMQGASLSTVVVFFSLIGGLQVFGLMGLIYGPLIFSVTLVLFRIYEKEFESFLDAQDHT